MPQRTLSLPYSRCELSREHFEVDGRYRLLENVNAAGHVSTCAAEDEETGECVQVQKVSHLLDDPAQSRTILRELRLLRHMQHENVVGIRNVFFGGDQLDFNTIYVVSELTDTSLAFLLRSPQALMPDHHLFFLYQLLRGMKYVHSANIVHGDLKPRNLLVNSNCDMKISGFGRASVTSREKEQDQLTPPPRCRWYRAPELLASGSTPSFASDMWSIGCIQAEIHLRRPLFHGLNAEQHLRLTTDLLGPPAYTEPKDVSAKAFRKYMSGVPILADITRAAPAVLVPCTLPQERNLVSSMLRWDPERRISLSEALAHPFLRTMHMPEDEPVREPIDPAEFAFEQRRASLIGQRREFFREALQYRPRLKRRYDVEAEERSWLGVATQLRTLCSATSKVVDSKICPTREFEKGQCKILALATLAVAAQVSKQGA